MKGFNRFRKGKYSLSDLKKLSPGSKTDSKTIKPGRLADDLSAGSYVDLFMDEYIDKFGGDSLGDDEEFSGYDLFEPESDDTAETTHSGEYDFETDTIFTPGHPLPIPTQPTVQTPGFEDSYENEGYEDSLENLYHGLEVVTNRTLGFERMFFDFKKDFSYVVSGLSHDIQSIDISTQKLWTTVKFLNESFSAQRLTREKQGSEWKATQALKIAVDNRDNINKVAEQFKNEQQLLNRSLTIMTYLFTPLKNTVDFLDRKISRVSENTRWQFLHLNDSIYKRRSEHGYSGFLEDRMSGIEEELDDHTDILRREKHANRRTFKSLSTDLELMKENVSNLNKINQTCCSKPHRSGDSAINESLSVLSHNLRDLSQRMLVQELKFNLENDFWTRFNFSYGEGNSDCRGERYVKKTAYNPGRYVGAILCSRDRYKLTLSDDIDGTFLDIGDEAGRGSDHCEFVGAKDTEMINTHVDVRRLSYAHRRRIGFLRRDWNETPQQGTMSTMTPSPSWYECGISIP